MTSKDLVTWSEIKPANSIPERSSHGVSVVGDRLYVFGGEHSARNPIGSELHSLQLAGPDQPRWQEVRTPSVPTSCSKTLLRIK